jgi:integrase
MRAIHKLSVKEAQRDLPPGLYGDGGGLYLQVSQQRTKAWVFRFMLAGRARKMGLGDFDLVTLKDAREKAREAHKLVKDGIDPIEVRAARKAALALERAKVITFKECADRYIAAQEGQWRNGKHRAQWKATLETYAYPVFGNLSVADIDTALVLRVLEPIWTTKNETASRLRGRIETILSWAKVRGYRTGENPATFKGNLKEALPKVSRANRGHHAALPYRDIPAFMQELRAAAGMSARALEWTILTAARTSETIEARWNEIDEENRLWIVPAGRMKAGVEHRVPLSDAALRLLRSLPREGALIFPGAREGQPLSNMAMLELLRGMRGKGLTVHGFRSSFMDWGHETTGYPKEMLDIALAHKVADKVEAAYRRGDMIEKRRRLMTDWADYCVTVRTGETRNVVAMRAAQ